MSAVTEVHHGSGGFDLQLKTDSQASDLRNLLKYDGHVVITDARVDPGALTDATVLTLARYVGVIKGLDYDKRGRVSGLSGEHLQRWLSDVVYLERRTFNLNTLTAVLTDLLQRDDASDGPITAGTITDPSAGAVVWSGDFPANHKQLDALEYVIGLWGQQAGYEMEYRVNSDGTIDVGPSSTLFGVGAPGLVLTPVPGDEGVSLRGLRFGRKTGGDRPTDVVVVGQGVGSPVTGTATQAGFPADSESKDIHGLTIKRHAVVNEPVTSAADAADRAALHLAALTDLATEFEIDLNQWEAGALTDAAGVFGPGSAVYVWFPEAGIEDSTNPVDSGGLIVYPVEYRVTKIVWSLRRGMGVYHRDGDGTYTDITDSISYDKEPGASATLSSKAAPLLADPTGITNDVVNLGELDPGTIPKPPTNLVLTDSGYRENAVLHGRIEVAFDAPTQNTDNTVLLDLTHYEIAWRRSGYSTWQRQNVSVNSYDDDAGVFTIDGLVIGATYYIQVKAIDYFGNASTALAGNKAISDASSPSEPMEPTLAGSGSNGILVEYDLTKQAGGAIETDVVTVRVYIGTSLTGLYDASKRAGEIPIEWANHLDGLPVRAVFTKTPSIAAFTRGKAYYVGIVVRDAFGNSSIFNSVATPVTAGDTTAPAVPTGVSLANVDTYVDSAGQYRARVRMKWTPPADEDTERYVVRYTRTGVTDWELTTQFPADFADFAADGVVIAMLPPGQSYDFQVRAVDGHGNSSAYTTAATIVTGTDTTAPDTAPTPTLTQMAGGKVKASVSLGAGWGTSNPDVRTLQIFAGPTTTPTTKVAVVRVTYEQCVTGDTIEVEWTPDAAHYGANYYARVKAKDMAGNISAAYSTVSAALALVGVVNADIATVGPEKLIDGLQTAVIELDGTGSYEGTYAAGTTGWKIEANGDAEFNNIVARGTIYATAGELGDLTITGTLSSDPAAAQAANWSQHLYFNGTSNTRIETADSVANSFGGDADIAVLMAPDDWTPASDQTWAHKWLTTGDQRSWMLILQTDGKIRLQWTTNGLDATAVTATSTVATGFTDGAKKWIRATIDVNDGSGNRVIKFYTAPVTSSDPDSYDDRPGTWTQLGTTITTAGTTSIYDATCDLQLGGWNEGQGYRPTGKVYGILIDKGYDTATLWADANVRLLIGETNPSTSVGYTGWPIAQVTGLDDSPTPVNWTISDGQPGMTLESLLVPEVGFSIDGQTGRESFNTLQSFDSYTESLVAVTASYASVITKTIKLPFTAEVVLIKVFFVAYTTDLGENETIFLQPKVTVGSQVYTGPEISDSNPNATGGAGTLDTTGIGFTTETASSHAHIVLAASHDSGEHSITGAPSVTLADKKSNLTSVPFVPGGGPVYVSGDEFTVELQVKGTNYTGKPRFGLMVEVHRAQS